MGGQRYAAAVAAELTREYQRRDRLDSRAAAIVTSSTAVSAALIALLVLGRGAQPALPLWTAFGAAAGAILLVIAWVLCILVNLPRDSGRLPAPSLRRMVTKHWNDPVQVAEQHIATAQVDMLEALRPSNDQRTKLLAKALWLQVAGVAILAVSLVSALFTPTG